jgi:amicyanin
MKHFMTLFVALSLFVSAFSFAQAKTPRPSLQKPVVQKGVVKKALKKKAPKKGSKHEMKKVEEGNKPAVSVPPASTPLAVGISGFVFVASDLKVKVGDTVTWTNNDSAPHTVTADDGKTFASPTLSQGGTFSFTFTTPGTFAYHCAVHPSMKGVVVVE